MSQTSIEKLKLLEWLDNFLQNRIKIFSKCNHKEGLIVKSYDKDCKCVEIIKVYEEAIEWNKKQRIKLANEVLKVSGR